MCLTFSLQAIWGSPWDHTTRDPHCKLNYLVWPKFPGKQTHSSQAGYPRGLEGVSQEPIAKSRLSLNPSSVLYYTQDNTQWRDQMTGASWCGILRRIHHWFCGSAKNTGAWLWTQDLLIALGWELSTDQKVCVLFFPTTLLRYNSHTIQFDHLKCPVQWCF